MSTTASEATVMSEPFYRGGIPRGDIWEAVYDASEVLSVSEIRDAVEEAIRTVQWDRVGMAERRAYRDANPRFTLQLSGEQMFRVAGALNSVVLTSDALQRGWFDRRRRVAKLSPAMRSAYNKLLGQVCAQWRRQAAQLRSLGDTLGP